MLRAKYLISSHYSTIVLFNGFLFVIQLFYCSTVKTSLYITLFSNHLYNYTFRH